MKTMSQKIKQFWNSNSLNVGFDKCARTNININIQNVKDTFYILYVLSILYVVLGGWCIQLVQTPSIKYYNYTEGDDWSIHEYPTRYNTDVMTDEVTKVEDAYMTAYVGSNEKFLFASRNRINWSAEHGILLELTHDAPQEIRITLRFDGGELIETTWFKMDSTTSYVKPEHPAEFQKLLLKHKSLIMRYERSYETLYGRTWKGEYTTTFNIAGYYKVIPWP